MRNDLYIPIADVARFRMGIDGTGIRTLICTYGCPLCCKYCPNPQSWDAQIKPTVYAVEELYDMVRTDSLYFQMTGGGITFGGGEPLLHMAAIEKFVALCPECWNFWVETSLHVSEDAVIRASNVFDMFVVDLKTVDPNVYYQYTGGDVKQVLHNLNVLLDRASPEQVIVRVPQISCYVDYNLQRKGQDYLKSLGITKIDAFTYSILRNKENEN